MIWPLSDRVKIIPAGGCCPYDEGPKFRFPQTKLRKGRWGPAPAAKRLFPKTSKTKIFRASFDIAGALAGSNPNSQKKWFSIPIKL